MPKPRLPKNSEATPQQPPVPVKGAGGVVSEEAPPSMGGADLGINLLVSVLVAGGLGYAADKTFQTGPWGMLLGGTLGFAAWLRQVWKVFQKK